MVNDSQQAPVEKQQFVPLAIALYNMVEESKPNKSCMDNKL